MDEEKVVNAVGSFCEIQSDRSFDSNVLSLVQRTTTLTWPLLAGTDASTRFFFLRICNSQCSSPVSHSLAQKIHYAPFFLKLQRDKLWSGVDRRNRMYGNKQGSVTGWSLLNWLVFELFKLYVGAYARAVANWRTMVDGGWGTSAARAGTKA